MPSNNAMVRGGRRDSSKTRTMEKAALVVEDVRCEVAHLIQTIELATGVLQDLGDVRARGVEDDLREAGDGPRVVDLVRGDGDEGVGARHAQGDLGIGDVVAVAIQKQRAAIVEERLQKVSPTRDSKGFDRNLRDHEELIGPVVVRIIADAEGGAGGEEVDGSGVRGESVDAVGVAGLRADRLRARGGHHQEGGPEESDEGTPVCQHDRPEPIQGGLRVQV
jgi:hypothetical protein